MHFCDHADQNKPAGLRHSCQGMMHGTMKPHKEEHTRGVLHHGVRMTDQDGRVQNSNAAMVTQAGKINKTFYQKNL